MYTESDNYSNPTIKHVLYVEVLPAGYKSLSLIPFSSDIEDPLSPSSKPVDAGSSKNVDLKSEELDPTVINNESNKTKTAEDALDLIRPDIIENNVHKLKKKRKFRNHGKKKKARLKHGAVNMLNSTLKCDKTYNNEVDDKNNPTNNITKIKPYKPQYVCKISDCEFSCHQMQDLNKHRKKYHKDFKEYQCHECVYRGATSSDLKKHFRQHSNERPYVCNISECNFKAKHKNSLVYHTKKYHPTGEPLHCRLCDFKTHLPCKLRLHTMVHHGAGKTLCCEQCSYKCYVMGDLRKHQRIHTGDSPYQCTECSYKCKISSNLNKHFRIHTMEQPFQCDQCEFRTNFINSLKVHKRTHSNEKPYLCVHCNYKCNHMSNLKKHIQRLHPSSILTVLKTKSNNITI